MIANDALFTFIGLRTGIAFWRQLIWLIGVIIMFSFIKRNEIDSLALYIYKKYFKVFICVFVLSIVTILVDGFNPVRIIYTWIEYSYGLPFLLFPMICRKCGWSVSKMNYLFIFLGSFLTTGLLLDYFFGGLFTTAFALSVGDGIEHFDTGRYNFLSTSNGILTVYYSLCLFCCFYEFHRSKSTFLKFLLILLTVFFIFGSIYTGARQTLVGLILMELIGVLSIIRRNIIGSIILFVTMGLLFSIVVPSVSKLLSDNQGYQNRYTVEAIKEDTRSEMWNRGFNDNFVEASVRRLTIGDGVGLVNSQKANVGEATGPNYENTFFARISEIGVMLGLLSLLIPVFFLMKKRGIVLYNLHWGVILSFLFISVVSPNGATNQSQMAIFILLGMYIEDYRQENVWKRRI